MPLDPTPRTSPTAVSTPRALLTVSGGDRRGVTARLFTALAAPGGQLPPVEVVDIEQVVVHGQLVLGVVVGALPAEGGPVEEGRFLAALERLAAEVAEATGVRIQVESAADAGLDAAPEGRPHHVILLGRPVPPEAVAGAAAAIAGIGGNIEAIRRLSDYPVTSFELTVSGAEAT